MAATRALVPISRGKSGHGCTSPLVGRDPNNASSLGLILEIPDMAAFEALLASDEGQRAMREDGLEETMRVLVEFTP